MNDLCPPLIARVGMKCNRVKAWPECGPGRDEGILLGPAVADKMNGLNNVPGNLKKSRCDGDRKALDRVDRPATYWDRCGRHSHRTGHRRRNSPARYRDSRGG